MEEYSIWEKIFDTKDDIELERLLRLVVFDEDARDLVFDKLLYYKNIPEKMVNINIRVDKEINNFPFEKLISQISSDIMEQMKKEV